MDFVGYPSKTSNVKRLLLLIVGASLVGARVELREVDESTPYSVLYRHGMPCPSFVPFAGGHKTRPYNGRPMCDP